MTSSANELYGEFFTSNAFLLLKDGDTLTTRDLVALDLINGEGVVNVTISGGTGDFQGATGRLTSKAMYDPITGILSGNLRGKSARQTTNPLRYPRRAALGAVWLWVPAPRRWRGSVSTNVSSINMSSNYPRVGLELIFACFLLGACHVIAGLNGVDEAESVSSSSAGGETLTMATTGGGTGGMSTSASTNGAACDDERECDSGFCVDGVCCDSACDTVCVSCARPGLEGQCSPYDAGTDPEAECLDVMCNGLAGCIRASCYDILLENLNTPTGEVLTDGVYYIDPDGSGSQAPFAAYCNMTDEGGGWTLVMKIKGDTDTLTYDSVLWENQALLNGSLDVVTEENAKFATWNTVPVVGFMVGMRALSGGRMEYRAWGTNGHASSQELFSNQALLGTSIGLRQWENMIPGMSVQSGCSNEGINWDGTLLGAGMTKVRVGVLADDEPSCNSPDSFIGIGGVIDSVSCPPSFENQQYAAGNVNCDASSTASRVAAFAVLFMR